VVICAFISPFAAERAFARKRVPEGRFLEVYVRCAIDECKRRDPKGLYKKAERGEISGFTGVDSAYEEPNNPELVIDTDTLSEEESIAQLVSSITGHLGDRGPAPDGKAGAAGRWR
jgi:adenylylsulfate kinase-like enzyme